MIRPWLVRLFVLVACLASLVLPSVARAQAKGPVHVVNLDSDDATEDHADALTAALKSRVRSTPGWQISETNDSLSMLLPALKCSAKPDAACLQRIGDQLKTDRFFWGSVTKSTMPHQVSAEVHLWVRGKPDQSVKEVYSDNLKDQNDETLRKIAAHLFERLSGAGTEGTISIKSSVEGAAVFVDGEQKGVIKSGVATLTLSAGNHNVELRADGYAATGQSVAIVTGAESTVTIEPQKGAAATSGPETPTTPGKPLPVRKIVGLGAMGVGVVAAAVGVVYGVAVFEPLRDTNQANAQKTEFTGIKFCTPPSTLDPQTKLDADAACKNKQSADSALIVESVIIGVGAAAFIAGAVILLTDKPASSDKPAAAARVRVVPSFGPGGGGLTLTGAF